jgi:undecaprenyl-diphosphatase
LTPLQGLILGIVQGLAEFLPVSSSAHLVLVPWLLAWPPHGLTYDVALHMGTLAALLVYFWRDWWRLVAAWLPAGQLPATGGAVEGVTSEHVSGDVQTEQGINRRLGISLVVATIPAAILGALFSDRVEESLRLPVLIALLLAMAGILLAAADRAGIKRLGLEAIGPVQALAIGVAQALALAPGVSRSGVTLAAALFLGLTREAAARFVFLMAAPITAGAGVFQLRHLAKEGIAANERSVFLIGIAASFVVGLAAIHFLLGYVRRRSLDVFVWYRVAVAVLVIFVAILRFR